MSQTHVSCAEPQTPPVFSPISPQWYQLHSSWGWSRLSSSEESSPTTPICESKRLSDFGATLPAALGSDNNVDIIEDHIEEQVGRACSGAALTIPYFPRPF